MDGCRVNVLIEDGKGNKCTFTYDDSVQNVYELCEEITVALGHHFADYSYLEVQNSK